MNYTKHYQLNQWDAGDRVLRQDFNADNQKIDAALAGLCRISAGSYQGNNSAQRLIDLGQTPIAVYLCTDFGLSNNSIWYYGGLAFRGHPVISSGDMLQTLPVLKITNGGFQVFYLDDGESGRHIYSNCNLYTYHYLAFFKKAE